jgi:hypothetical protein
LGRRRPIAGRARLFSIRRLVCLGLGFATSACVGRNLDTDHGGPSVVGIVREVGRGAPPAEPARPAYLAVAVNGSVWLQLGRLLMCDLSVSFPLAFGPSNVPLIFSPSDSVLPK